jgi:osmotically inducible protein OsmC
MAEAIYTAVATARGDGRNGEVTSSDGVIDESLAVPKEMGGPGGEKTNPEQLFAAGYAACFHGTIQMLARAAKVKLTDSTVTAEVSFIKQDSGAFGLGVALKVELLGLEQGSPTFWLGHALFSVSPAPTSHGVEPLPPSGRRHANT